MLIFSRSQLFLLDIMNKLSENNEFLKTLKIKSSIEHFEDLLYDYEYFDKFQEIQLSIALRFIYSEFEHYLFKCIKYILMKYPSRMSEKEIKIGMILNYNYDINTVIEAKAEMVVENLLRKNFNDIFNKISDFYGIKHNITEQEIYDISELRQIRNLFTHGDGTVTHIYLNRVKDTPYKLGEKLKITTELHKHAGDIVYRITKKFDEALLIKYPELTHKENSSN